MLLFDLKDDVAWLMLFDVDVGLGLNLDLDWVWYDLRFWFDWDELMLIDSIIWIWFVFLSICFHISLILYCNSGHRGEDGRYYMLDFARAMPPEGLRDKTLRQEHDFLYRLLRPEYTCFSHLCFSHLWFSHLFSHLVSHLCFHTFAFTSRLQVYIFVSHRVLQIFVFYFFVSHLVFASWFFISLFFHIFVSYLWFFTSCSCFHMIVFHKSIL